MILKLFDMAQIIIDFFIYPIILMFYHALSRFIKFSSTIEERIIIISIRDPGRMKFRFKSESSW